MTDAEIAVQLVFPGFKCGIDDLDEARLLTELGVGGFCVYGGGDAAELARLTSTLQGAAQRPLLFCADYEDGVHTQCPAGTPLPSNMGLGASGREALAFQKGALTAVESRAVGVPWILAPVCDLATRPENPIVNTRSFGADPALVVRMARAYLKGLRSEGALGCLKHFPGHGETRKDSHLELPDIAADEETLSRRELVPFEALAGEADAVMTGHLTVPALVGDRTPYSLSADVARTLRGRLRFEGLVSTDALSMQAIASNYDELDAARRALLGGSDILLVPSKALDLSRALIEAVEHEPALAAAARRAFERLEKARAACGLTTARAAARVVDPSLVGSSKHRQAAEAMAESCLAWAARPEPLSGSIRYFEAETDGPEEWFGADFVAELRACGVRVEPMTGTGEPRASDVVVLGVFLSPRAYTGRIAFDEDDAAALRAKLARAARAVIVSFGSPFVFDALGRGGLCAFTRGAPAQRAAARALAGKLEVTGTMPVPLRLAAAG